MAKEENRKNVTRSATAPGDRHTGTEKKTEDLNLLELFLYFLGKAHWIVLAAMIGAVAAGLIDFKLVKPVYQTTAKIYIVGSDSTISLSDLQIGSNLAADYQEVFKNWHVHEMVRQRLNLDYSYSELSDMVSASNPSGTHVLYVNVRNQDPEEAKLIADTYAQVAREFIAAKMDMREPNIFEEAMLPTSPVLPRKTRDIATGFILGALAAVMILTILLLYDDRIRTSEDIAKAGNLPTLGMIPLENEKTNVEKKKENRIC